MKDLQTTNSTAFKFGSHFVLSRKSSIETSEPLAKLNVAFIGNDRDFEMISEEFRNVKCEVDRYSAMEELLKGLKETSAYQPVFCVIGMDQADELEVTRCLDVLSDHLMVRVVQVVGASGRRVKNCFQNPCSPVRFVCLPKDDDELTWQVEDFNYKAVQFAVTVKRMLRFSSLNARESKIAEYISRGLPNKKICKLLGVSEKTIEKCRKETYEKLGVSSGPELASLITIRNYFRWPKSVPYPSR